MTFVPGTCLGPYEIVAFLGAGGMGRVYKVQDTDIKEKVALKQRRPGIRPERLNSTRKSPTGTWTTLYMFSSGKKLPLRCDMARRGPIIIRGKQCVCSGEVSKKRAASAPNPGSGL